MAPGTTAYIAACHGMVMTVSEWDGLDQALDAIGDASMELLRAYHLRLERELVGAWMAGYDAVDIVFPADVAIGPKPWSEDPDWNATLTIRAGFVPVHDQGLTPYPSDYAVERIDVSGLTPEAASKFRQDWQDWGDGDA